MDTSQGRRNLWFYAAANAISRFGSQYQFLAVTALTYAVTNSALFTALQMAVTGLPVILLARWSGLPADRYDPRKVVTVVSVVQAVLTLGYLLSNSVAWILALNLVVSTASSFAYPARATLVPQMVGRSHLMQANARLATVSGAVELISPILAGFMLIHTSTSAAFLFNAASFLFPAGAMFLVQLVEPLERKNRVITRESALRTAWGFLKGSRGMIRLLAGYGAYMIGMWSVNVIFYPYTKEILHRGADVFGWSISAYFGAYALTGFILERWGSFLRRPALLYAGYLLGAVVWVGYAFTRSVPVALVLSAFDGFVYTYAVTLFQTRIQEEAPPQERGRIFGVVSAYEEVATVSGQLMGGFLATATGILAGIRLSAGLTAVLVLIVLWGGRITASGRRAALRAERP